MDLHLKGKRVLVTGATQGIGLATAALFAEEGCSVVLVSRSEERLSSVADMLQSKYGANASSLAADLSRTQDVEMVAERCGSIDILINNAGAIPPGNLAQIGGLMWREAWDLKVFGYIDLTRLLYERLKTTRGVIVNVIGTSGERAEPNYIAGSSGNAALMAFTKGLGSNSPRDGVRVVGVNPGPVATERIERLLRSGAKAKLQDESTWQEWFQNTPFGRAATPEEIANSIVFLASPRSSYTSGTILTIDDPARASL